MPDSSLTKDKLLEATRHVAFLIEQDLQPQEAWGVYPYFRFRGQSEQQSMQEPADLGLTPSDALLGIVSGPTLPYGRGSVGGSITAL